MSEFEVIGGPVEESSRGYYDVPKSELRDDRPRRRASGGSSDFSDSEAHNWAMLTHLSALTGYVGVPFGNFLGPLVMWMAKREESDFVDEHGKEALNFHLSIMIYEIACIPLCFVLIGIPILLGLIIGEIALTIMAGVAAGKGEHYEYPFVIRFIK